jgi:hypothetical protein
MVVRAMLHFELACTPGQGRAREPSVRLRPVLSFFRAGCGRLCDRGENAIELRPRGNPYKASGAPPGGTSRTKTIPPRRPWNRRGTNALDGTWGRRSFPSVTVGRGRQRLAYSPAALVPYDSGEARPDGPPAPEHDLRHIHPGRGSRRTDLGHDRPPGADAVPRSPLREGPGAPDGTRHRGRMWWPSHRVHSVRWAPISSGRGTCRGFRPGRRGT